MMKRKYGPIVGLLVVATCATLESLALPTPALWYTAEKGVTTDANGNVTKWANQGSLGTVGDVFPATTATSITLNKSATLAGYQAVHLDVIGKCVNYLTTQNPISIAISQSSGATWFLVCDFLGAAYSGRVSLFGFDNAVTASANNLCALYLADANVNGLRAFFGGSNYVTMDVDPSHNPGRRLLTAVGFPSFVNGFVSGGLSATGSWSKDFSIPESKFMLGSYGLSGYSDFRGHLGEFRLYPTALTAAERFAVEGELAARHHFDLTPETETTIPAALLKKHATDPNAIGNQPNGGKAVSPVPVSAASGALTVTLTSAPAATDTALVYFAHDGETGVRRTWCVAGTTAARAIPLKLSFDATEYPTLDCACLRRRSDGDSAWTAVVGATFAKTPTALEFVLPAGWQNGQYCLVPGSVLAPETLLDTTVNDADTWNTTGYGNALPVTEYAETASVESTVRLVYPSAVLQVFDSFRTGSFFTVE